MTYKDDLNQLAYELDETVYQVARESRAERHFLTCAELLHKELDLNAKYEKLMEAADELADSWCKYSSGMTDEDIGLIDIDKAALKYKDLRDVIFDENEPTP